MTEAKILLIFIDDSLFFRHLIKIENDIFLALLYVCRPTGNLFATFFLPQDLQNRLIGAGGD